MGCTHLLRLLQETEGPQAKFKSLRLVHVKRDFNAAADYVSKRVIQDQSSLEVTDPGEHKLLQGLNRIHEKTDEGPELPGTVAGGVRVPSHGLEPTEELVLGTEADESGTDNPGAVDPRSNASGINESGTDGPGTDDPGTNESGTDGLEDEPTAAPRSPDCQDFEEDPENVRRERWRRICSHQAHDPGLAPLIKFLRGEYRAVVPETNDKIADQFVLDSRDALFYVSRNT
ncbi:hypothetical protein PHMEG_00039271 [Phytophthora megakarya]|uniref:Reverse transcriptase n=1 Tax=Phytophthora megakarya TaxID=4795 RepID=A0A225UFR4_9STRA|nr:hypothetical protein PHMEG_00039271 [Phytophthora megakarya]